VLRGAIGVGLASGESAALPEQGVMANINLANVNLDSWEDLLGQPMSGGTGAANAKAAPGPGGPTYLPTVMAVRAKELTVQGRALHNVTVGASRDGPTWRGSIDANELNGYAEYRQPAAAGGARLYARLARMSLGQAATKEVESLLDEQPTALPALDVVVDDFELKNSASSRSMPRIARRACASGA
jgi:uncharacterized protein YhdP